MPDDLKSASQIAATLITLVCAALAGFTWWVSVRATGTGGAGLVVIFPIIAMVGAHIFMGPVAVVLALLTRRFWKNAWIFVYFLIIGPTMLVALSGGSPVAVLNDTLRGWAVARDNPDETELCDVLAESLERTSGERVPEPMVAFEPELGFDFDFRCWPKSVPVDGYYRRSLRGASLTHIAVAAGETQVLEALFANGVDVNFPGKDGVTPLLFALSQGAPVSREGGFARHHLMVGLRPRIEFLADHGADPTIADTSGVTPLHWAAALGDVALVSRFLEAGAVVDAAAGNSRRTPLGLAIGAMKLAIGSTTPRREPPGYDEGATAAYGEVIRRLLAAGADFRTVLEAGRKLGSAWLFHFVADEGVDLTPHIPEFGRDWLTVALYARDEALIAWLVEHGVDLNTPDRSGEVLLHRFTYRGLEWQLQWALDAGVDLERKNSRGETPLEVAVARRHVEGVKRLVAAGATVTPDARRLANPEIDALLE